MARVDRRAVAKHLTRLEPEELQQEILQLYDLFPGVRDWYKNELDEGEGIVLEQYKQKIEKAYFPTRKTKKGIARRCNANCRSWLSEFRKIASFDSDMIDLLLFRVATGTMAAQKPFKKYETYYKPLLTSFEDALFLIRREGMAEKYEEQIAAILSSAKNQGFDYPERLQKLVDEYLSAAAKATS